MTKEEILNKHVSLYFSSHHDRSRWNGEGGHGGAEWHTDKAIAADIYKAMDEWAGYLISNSSHVTTELQVPKHILDEYAKQQAIEFVNWLSEEMGEDWCFFEDKNMDKPLTKEELYIQFIEQQNKSNGE